MCFVVIPRYFKQLYGKLPTLLIHNFTKKEKLGQGGMCERSNFNKTTAIIVVGLLKRCSGGDNISRVNFVGVRETIKALEGTYRESTILQRICLRDPGRPLPRNIRDSAWTSNKSFAHELFCRLISPVAHRLDAGLRDAPAVWTRRRQTDFIRVRLDNRYIKLLIMIKVIMPRSIASRWANESAAGNPSNRHTVHLLLPKKTSNYLRLSLRLVTWFLKSDYDHLDDRINTRSKSSDNFKLW